LLPWKRNNYYTFWLCVCSLSYPGWKAHVPHYTLSVTCRLYRIFHFISLTARFSAKFIEHKMVFFYSLHKCFPKTFLILRRIQRDTIIIVHRASGKVSVIVARFEWKLNFLDRFSKNTEISNFIKIRPLWAQLIHADERTDKQTWWN
jgi:hypothetical protein